MPTTGTATQQPDTAAVPLGGPASAAREVGGLGPRAWGGGAGASRRPRAWPGLCRLTRAVLQPVTTGTGDPTAAGAVPAAQAMGVATQSVACVCVRLATQARGANSVSPGAHSHTPMPVHAHTRTQVLGALVLSFCPGTGGWSPPLSFPSCPCPARPRRPPTPPPQTAWVCRVPLEQQAGRAGSSHLAPGGGEDQGP